MTQKSRRSYTCPICAGSMIEDVPAAQPFAWLYEPKVGDGPKERRLTFVDPDSWGTTLGLEVIPLYATPDPRIAELEADLAAAQAERDAYLLHFAHRHVSWQTGGDDCKKCGLDLRDPIHSQRAIDAAKEGGNG